MCGELHQLMADYELPVERAQSVLFAKRKYFLMFNTWSQDSLKVICSGWFN